MLPFHVWMCRRFKIIPVADIRNERSAGRQHAALPSVGTFSVRSLPLTSVRPSVGIPARPPNNAIEPSRKAAAAGAKGTIDATKVVVGPHLVCINQDRSIVWSHRCLMDLLVELLLVGKLPGQ